MIIDITQNSAWPTGGTHIPLADSHKTLLFGLTTVRGPQAWQGRVPPLHPLRLYTFFGRVVPLLAKGLNMLEYIPDDKKLIKVVAGRCVSKSGAFGSWKVKSSTQLDWRA